MKFEVKYELMNGTERSFITKDYEEYTPEFGVVNGIFQIGFIKEGAKDTSEVRKVRSQC